MKSCEVCFFTDIESTCRSGSVAPAGIRWDCVHQHGSSKLMHPSEFAAEFGISIWLALATMLIQLGGGILLILGALTPVAALGIAGTMLTATIFLINRGEPFINPAGHSWENSAFYMTASICLALSGAGPWSVDARLFGRKQKSVDTDRFASRSAARQKT
jgi:uncharacterized membrane protein YphA (DoxX/SURF4 family)